LAIHGAHFHAASFRGCTKRGSVRVKLFSGVSSYRDKSKEFEVAESLHKFSLTTADVFTFLNLKRGIFPEVLSVVSHFTV